MPKITGNGQSSRTNSSATKLVYPAGCKEVNEEVPTDDLIRRMKDIAMAFQQMSQEEDNNCYIPLALYLATDFFLEHPSRDVRLLVACAVADVFRVYAPNAPYQHPHLIKRIFLFFIQQLKGLQDPKDPTFKRYFYLLENLAWVKSFNICIELEDSQYIFCQLFSLIFRIVNENHSEKVKNFMLDMLTPLIIEADTVSPKLVEIILWQIIDPKKTQNKQACWMATQILRKTSKTMEPCLITFFNNAVTHGVQANAGELSDDEDPNQSISASMKVKNKNNQTMSTSVTQLCELLYELNQICPTVMDGILPQLDFKIRSNEEKERCEFTKLLARLFSDRNSRLAEQYPELWKSFLGRFRDITVTVRMRCVQYSMHFLVNHPELRDDITEQLKQRQHDPDENVRYEVVMAIISAAKKGIENINENLLSFVKERTLDMKFKIRREALFGMAQLYKQYNVAALGDGEDDTPSDGLVNNSALKMLNWIKNKCLHNYYQKKLNDRLIVERILHTCLVPCNVPLQQRMKSLYTFYATIDGHAARAFNELLRQQQSVRKQVKEMLDTLKDEKSDDRDVLLKQRIQACAKNLPEPVKADEYLTKLCRNLEMNPTLRHHMEVIVTSTSSPNVGEDGSIVAPPSCTSIATSVKEVLKSLGYPVQTNSFYVIIRQLMERIAPVMIDYQGLILLFNYVTDSLLGDGEIDNTLGLENSAKRGLHLVLSLSQVFPAIFYGREIFTSYLLPFLWKSTEYPQIGEIVLQILTNVGQTTSANISPDGRTADSSLNSIPWWAADDDVIPRLIDNFIIKASTTKQAKYAVQCLNTIIQDDDEKLKIFAQILDRIKECGLTLESGYFRTHLVSIGMIAMCGGYVFFPKLLRSIVQKYVVQNLLMRDQRLIEEVVAQEENEKNREINDLALSYELCCEEVKCKIEGIKLMVRWLYGLKLNTLVASPENQHEMINAYQTAATNTLRIFKTVIQNGGDLNENGLAGTTCEKARLKLAAASAMIKIVANDSVTSHTSAMLNHNQSSNDAAITTTSNASAASQIMTPTQWHTLATVMLSEEEFVREKFAMKLHKGLISLQLSLEFLAILSLGGYFDISSPFRTKLRSYLVLNIAKRRDLVKSKSTINIKSILPDCIMPYVIHLLAYMPFYTQYDDTSQLEIVKNCLWFIIEPIVLKNEQFSFSFYKRTFENIKTCVDRVSATVTETDGDSNASGGPTMATMTNYKIYCACDLAMGLVMSKTQNFLLKDFPVQPSLPGKYYMVSPSAADNNARCYLPAGMQFSPPKRCGLEAEFLGKITRQFNLQTAPSPLPRSEQENTTDDKDGLINIPGNQVHHTRSSKRAAALAPTEQTVVIDVKETSVTSTPAMTTVTPATTGRTNTRRKQEVASTPAPTGRSTRTSTRNASIVEHDTSEISTNSVVLDDEIDIEEDPSKLDPVPEVQDESMAEDEEVIGEEESLTEETIESEIDVKTAGRVVPPKRGRGRPTALRTTTIVSSHPKSDDDSPPRKSARIARKGPSKSSSSPPSSPDIQASANNTRAGVKRKPRGGKR